MFMPRLPKPKGGRPTVDQYNARIVQLMAMGWGLDRIYRQLKSEGAQISRSTLHERMKEIREKDERGEPLPGLEDTPETTAA